MRPERFAVYALLILLAAHAAEARAGATQRRRASRAEQTAFNLEEPVRRPVALPRSVLDLLARDERVRECQSQEGGGAPAVRDRFVAAAVNLGGASGRAGYVVLPKGGCLLGANIGPFWVFAPEGRGHRLVLKTHALALTVGRKRTRGLRDIQISAASAVNVFESGFEFDGERYAPRWCRRGAIDAAAPAGRGRFVYYRCGDADKPY